MLRSTDRIRTTHVGSLARPPELLDLMQAAAQGRPVDPAELAEAERRARAAPRPGSGKRRLRLHCNLVARRPSQDGRRP